MACPYLEYRDATPADASEATTPPGGSFDEPRAFCAVAREFVQPMRADVCNDRYDLEHTTHCEIYREHEGNAEASDASGDDGESAGSR